MFRRTASVSPLRTASLASIALAICAAFGATASHAQAVAEPADSSLQKVEVIGAAQNYDARRNDTAAKIVVSQEEIVKHGDTTLADVLKRLPGITIGGTRGGNEIRMRGLGSGYTQILLNGEAAPPGFSLDSLAPDLIERIEIMRSASAEFSTQAIAGTINIVLKKTAKAGQRELKLNLAGSGSFVSPSANLQLSDKAGKLAWTLSANLNVGTFDQQSYRIDDGADASGTPTLLRRAERREHGRFANFNLSPRLNWTLENGDSVTLQSFAGLNRYDRQNANRWSATLGTVPPFAVDDVQTSGDSNILRSDLNWVHKFTGGGKLDSKFGLNSGARQSEYRQQAYNNDKLQTLDSLTLADAKDRGASFTGKYSMPFADDHSLTMGWDGGRNQRSESRVEADRPIPGYVPLNTAERYDATVSRLAVFAQDEWNVTPRWSVYLGLRWESLVTDSAGSGHSAVHNRSSVLSPLFQTLWKLPDSKNDQLRLAVTRTYKAPSTDRLIPRRFTTINNSAIEPDSQGNPNLRPELAWGIDTAWEHFFAEGALVSASAYLRRLDDFNRRAVTFNGARWIAMPVNDGRASTRGIELEAKFPLQVFFKQAPAIDVRANLARNWSTVEQVPGPDNRLADQTPFSANFGLDYRMNAQFNMGGTFTYKSGGPIRISENQATYATVKRELDVYGLWKFDARTQLRISAVNVLAQEFQYVESYADASGRLRNTSIFPVTALLRASFEIKF